MNGKRHIVIITGLSGAGKNTVKTAFEDLHYIATDSPPMSLAEQTISATAPHPHAVVLDVRSHGFSVGAFAQLIEKLEAHDDIRLDVVYLDCADHELVRRFSETRRTHPQTGQSIDDLLREERGVVSQLEELSTLRLDTTDLRASDVKVQIFRHFPAERHTPLFEFLSFGFKHGLPRNAHKVDDLRSLCNPHWDEVLRHKTGQDADVVAYIMADESSARHVHGIWRLLMLIWRGFPRKDALL